MKTEGRKSYLRFVRWPKSKNPNEIDLGDTAKALLLELHVELHEEMTVFNALGACQWTRISQWTG